VKKCLKEPRFAPDAKNPDNFGGSKSPSLSFHFSPDASGGDLEDTPHGAMHTAVSASGSSGFMGNFTRAPLDPVFWLHHCNIDRLWEVWVNRDAKNDDPSDKDWLGTSFPFHNEKEVEVNMKPSEVVDTTVKALGYEYDDIDDPLK
jgi:tyrosinase